MGMPFLFRVLLCFFFFSTLNCEESIKRIPFLIRQGNQNQALELYEARYQTRGKHDFELLQQIGLAILDYGSEQKDPEIELLTLFGASISANESTYYILEKGLKSEQPIIQLIAIQALAKADHEQTDQLLLRALGSPYVLIRLETVYQLCKKKHPQAMSQVETLMCKTPKSAMAIYPQLFAMVGDERATRLLRKALNDTNEDVRTQAILSIAKYGRDDFLPQLRLQAFHLHKAQQEACVYALGVMKDEKSIDKLKKLANSQYPHVSLAAQLALYRLGQMEFAQSIAELAKKENLFAIAALAEIPEKKELLVELLAHPQINVRLNAALSLLHLQDERCLAFLPEILIRDKRSLGLISTQSPGQTLSTWKVMGSSSDYFREHLTEYQAHLELKISILESLRNLSEPLFLQVANIVFTYNENELIPTTVQLLEEIGTPAAIQLLKSYQQKIGAPLIRNYCTLSLYRLDEPGPYAQQLRQWAHHQRKQDLIRFQPIDASFDNFEKTYELTPEETSRFLIEVFEAFATKQDDIGIEALIDAIKNGNPKNKFALAGLLIRATH